MRQNRWRSLIAAIALLGGVTACDYIHDDLEPCPCGLYLAFQYDYNLQRADMFDDHVGSVTAYIFDDEGNFLFSRTESGDVLKQPGYRMKLDLSPGSYRYIALAGNRPLTEMQADKRGARFRLTEPKEGDAMEKLSLTLDHGADGLIPHEGLPLDTLWHGMSTRPVVVLEQRETVDTCSLVRDTKQINVVLRDLDDPAATDVADFDFRIYDRNTRLEYDNRVDESAPALYTPYAAWNTTDRDGTTEGRMAHTDFMTSRLIYHDKAADDGILSITSRKSGAEVVRVNLPDLLSRLRTSSEVASYAPQEFLDRGYDYRLVFFLKGGRWEYVNIEMSVLGWAKRIQREDIVL